MKSFLLLFILIGFNFGLIAQDCGTVKDVDWQFVEIRIMETKETVIEGYNVSGEGIVKVKKTIASLDDLNKKEKEEIQKYAAKFGSCLVFIDTKGLWDSEGFPTMASQQQLYYYWITKE